MQQIREIVTVMALNRDDDPAAVNSGWQRGDSRYILNMRTFPSDNGDGGKAKNVKGNVLVDYALPEGQNRLWLGNWKKDGPKELMAKIVPSPAGLDMDDELPMPDHLLQGVVDDVVKRYLSVPEGAEINDSRGAR